MVGQYFNSSVLYMQIKINKTLCSMMTRIRRQRNIFFQLSNSLNPRGLFLQGNCINGNRSSSFMLLKNMQWKMGISIYAGAAIIKWKIKNKKVSLEKQKAPISRRSFFYIVRCKKTWNNSTLASREFTCNNSMGCYV